MSICFYTITPQPEQNPVAYILRLFSDKDGYSKLINTRAFHVTNPQNPKATEETASLYGDLCVADFINQEENA
ncbi:hypothetical protein FAH67_00570 [Neisseria flavescens]|uniref:Uncharacterized protein n=1 Tax=Neisseria flavescens NRL30031/H210 TaxID=546264 RepID=C0ELZ6_NEIFL|nr:hypothetical protein [Neisseria flavescens]SPY02130.1 Uncharacterised protein [Neisseria meningitidis]EEG33859.1 hypothetical protein NEIFLAOT_00959 [Neisseria flavescens NRL30031/H210]QCL68079.1 hypothetical protein FAH67_00570 [Neisseria flavescens]SPY06539.1 Uncharacterised protein [Neisseria meningitidis]STZ64494.1 Uncharacterised protein [Neisseria flavescens]